MTRAWTLVLLAACTASPKSDGSDTMNVEGPVALQLCTSGTQGSSTCPVNAISLDTGSPGSSLTFIATVTSGSIVLTNIEVVPGADGLLLEDAHFVPAGASDTSPCADDGGTSVWPVIDAKSSFMLPDVTLGQYEKVCLAYTTIGTYLPNP
jgi:hypothetical protein